MFSENEARQFVAANSTGENGLDNRVCEWLKWDKNEETWKIVHDHLKSKNHDELRVLLKNRMQFGTAGLRSKLGAGFSRMNDLTIIQTAQGLCTYLQSQFKDSASRSIIVGYDARYGSTRFAQITAAIFLRGNFKVHLFSKVVPTPFVSYGVKHFGCVAGVMVTASHNPKEDNGYKVYFDNSAQIVPPHDTGISDSILANLEPWAESWNTEVTQTHTQCSDPLEEIMSCYMKQARDMCYNRSLNESSKLNITYTAMHGVGYRYVKRVFDEYSLKPFSSVVEQQEPDPEFPTVKFPNPEEGKSALDLAFKTASSNSSPLIVANDPDADRLALAEKNKHTGEWKVFTGNEIGALLGWWIVHSYKKANPNDLPSDNIYMLHSVVSSRILQAIANVEGFKVEHTLTGFKWMGNRADELIKAGKKTLFAFEEAIGFMCGGQVLDKDGVKAAAVASEMACYLYHNDLTLTEQLNVIYKTYGMHVSKNSYFFCYSPSTIEKIFTRIKKLNDGKYPDQIGKFKLSGLVDLYGDGYDSTTPDNKPVLPTSTSGQMMTLYFENGCVATVRTSGTEPKVKYYSELAGKPGDDLSKESASALLKEVVDSLVEELLEPTKNGLIPRSD